MEQDFQLVDHGNVHATVGVLENFARFSDFTAGDRHDLNHGVGVECRRQFKAPLSVTTNHFGNAVGAEVRITGIFPLRAVGEEEVLFNFEPALLKDREHDIAGGPRVGRALQDHELALAECFGDPPSGPLDVRKIRIATVAKRRGNTDQNDIGFAEATHLGGRLKLFLRLPLLDPVRRNVFDVALTLLE